MAQATVGRILRGEVDPQCGSLRRIARALRIPLARLLDMAQDESLRSERKRSGLENAHGEQGCLTPTDLITLYYAFVEVQELVETAHKAIGTILHELASALNPSAASMMELTDTELRKTKEPNSPT